MGVILCRKILDGERMYDASRMGARRTAKTSQVKRIDDVNMNFTT
jgi:hypothetical protein